MATLCRIDDIVIRVFFSRELGARVHAVCGDGELVVALLPLRVLQGSVPLDVQERVLAWAADHQRDMLAAWRRYEAGGRPYAWAYAA